MARIRVKRTVTKALCNPSHGSGSSGVREHVQRLGRILRQKPGKRAVLYELIAKDTGEQMVKERRRRHDAYKGSSQIFDS